MSEASRFHQLAARAKARIREVTAAEAEQLQRSGALFVDVREADEFAREHARGAVHMSRGTVEMKIEKQIPDVATPIVCYCGGGSRSALVADNLQQMGYTNVSSLAGGFKSWKEAGLACEV